MRRFIEQNKVMRAEEREKEHVEQKRALPAAAACRPVRVCAERGPCRRRDRGTAGGGAT